MCSIGGEIDFVNEIGVRDYHKVMLATMQRRGPDANGIYSSENAVLLHSRLAVIDVERGKQPMTFNYDGTEYTIVYNGEIYNTDEVRRVLEKKKISFETTSDTEVVLKAFAVLGEKCVDILNGIFAFAVWNSKAKRLFMARDRMGVKPFFYHLEAGSIVFASEIKSLFEHPKIAPAIDLDGICELLLVAPGRSPGCGVFKGIKELKQGHLAYFDKFGYREKKYWELGAKEHGDSFDETVEKVRFLVTDSIERQLISDVPVGTFLSGGLDSSLISSVAARYMKKRGERLKTFSVTYRDNEKYFEKSRFQPNSDEVYIKEMSEYLGSDHTMVVIDTPELAKALYAAVDARDLPGMADVDSSLLLFCEEIKKHVTVALSGECADEIFGGYPWYRDEKIRSAYGFPWAQSTEYRSGFLKKEIINKINPSLYVNSRYDEYIALAPKLDGEGDTNRRMREMVYLNMHWFMQTLLDRKDRMSMYSGLEVRVPFCDYRIADYLYSVPWEMKDYNGREKGLLRYAAEGLLPENILWRKKSPYPKTHNPAYLGAVISMLEKILADKDSPIFEIVSYDALSDLLYTKRDEPWYGQLMTTPQTIAFMIQVNYWLEKFNVKIDI